MKSTAVYSKENPMPFINSSDNSISVKDDETKKKAKNNSIDHIVALKEKPLKHFMAELRNLFLSVSDIFSEKLHLYVEIRPKEIDFRLFQKKKSEIIEVKSFTLDWQKAEEIEEVKKELSILLKSGKKGPVFTSLVYANSDSLLEIVKLPKLSHSRLKKSVYWMIKQKINYFDEGDFWNYEILDEFEENGQTFNNVEATIIRGEKIRSVMSLLDKVNIIPDRIVLKSSELNYTFHVQGKTKKNISSEYFFVDVNRNYLTVNFVKNDNLLFMKNIPNRLFTLSASAQQSAIVEIKKTSDYFEKLIIRLSGETKRIIDYIEEKFSINDIKDTKIFINYPEYSNTNEPMANLLAETGNHFEIIDSFELKNRCQKELFIVNKRRKKLNLGNFLPDEIVVEKKFKLLFKPIATLIVFIMLLPLYYSVNLQTIIDKKLMQVERLREKIKPVTESIEKEKQIMGKIQNKLVHLGEMKSLLKGDIIIQKNFRIISNLVPPGIILTRYEHQEKGNGELFGNKKLVAGQLEVDGRIDGGREFGQILLFQFIDNIKNSRCFNDVQLFDQSFDPKGESILFKIKVETK